MNDTIELFDNICQTPFWDTSLSWNTTSPKFTPCFVDTALAWPPAIFLWLTFPYSLYDYLKSQRPSIKWNRFNKLKFFIAGLLSIVGVIHVIHVLYLFGRQNSDSILDKSSATTAHLIAVLLDCSTFILLVVFLYLQRLFGYINGGAIWFYLLFQLITFGVSIPSASGYMQTYQVIYVYLEFSFHVLLFILCSFADRVPNMSQLMSSVKMYGNEAVNEFDDSTTEQKNPQKIKRKICPKETASFPSKLMFFWFDKFAYLGFRRPLTPDDLWEIRRIEKCQNLFSQFNKLWKHKTFEFSNKNDDHLEEKPSFFKKASFYLNEDYGKLPSNKDGIEEQSNRRLAPKINLFFALSKMFWFYFLLPSVARFCTDLLQLANPMVLKYMIAFTTSSEPFWHGVFYTMIFVLTNVVQSLTSAYHQHRMLILGMRVRSCLIGSIYRKSLVLAPHAKKNYTTGEIVNLMAVDSQRFIDMVPFICFLWTAPVQIAIALYLLWNELGPSVFGGLVLMLIFVPVNGFIASKVKKLQGKQMKLKDERLKAISEMLSGIKVLKLYAWENAFVKNIEKIRKKELGFIRKSGFISVVFVCISSCSPFFVSCLTFAIFIFTNPASAFTADKAFVSIALFNLLRIPLTMIPNMLSSLILTLVSLKRLNNFINCDEVEDYVTHNFDKENAVSVSDATFSWESGFDPKDKVAKMKIPETLSNVNLTFKKNSLVAVVGSVGSGKSSLLYSLLGEMQKQFGRVNISSDMKLAYVPQQAWIQNSTVRENILFGLPFNKEKYDKVIRACALKEDLKMLTGGDQTEIGEKGINLSGGQKQRVSIARACYSDSNLFLFDDPLSAVDSHVGKHIFDEVLSHESGILKGSTRILVTNALYMLPFVDQVILLKSGTVDSVGTYKELMNKNSYFHELITNYTNSNKEEESENVLEPDLDFVDPELMNDPLIRSLSISSTKERHMSYTRQVSTVSSKSDAKPAAKDVGKLVEAEAVESGQISFGVYKKFFQALSTVWCLVIGFNYVMSITVSSGSSFWLSDWTKRDDLNDEDNRFRLGIYFCIGIFQVLFVCCGWISIIKGTMNASSTLHNRLIKSIVHAPMHFFDTTPLGRIMNRFSKDIEILDSYMQFLIRVLLNTSFQVLATIFIVSFNTQIFLAFVVPFLGIYFFVQRFYVSTSRQLKRLESVTRSPILTHFSETINGVTTIKAYNVRERFIHESDCRVDNNQRCFYPSSVANCWLQVRLEFLANCLIFFASFFAALSRDTLSGSETGLSLSYALNVTLSLNWCVRMFADLENNVVSVERISEYTDVPPEAPKNMELDNQIVPVWPHDGEIKFINYCTRYRPGLDLVIKGIDLSINKGEKIGIVGRTGAGKSSLTLALFRIIEASQGQILIDGVDISKLGLHKLRSRITIIPQDPVLFCGSLRFNIDPFDTYTDEQLWNVLKLSHLRKFVSSLEAGLNYTVAEAGENLSVGQRQLICLARALLRRTNVLVLDEATAAVDFDTDSLIQTTIREEFSNCTVLTIAHRLNTILDSDRVLVLDAGKIAEFDSPKALLSNDSSIFYSLAKDAGIV